LVLEGVFGLSEETIKTARILKIRTEYL